MGIAPRMTRAQWEAARFDPERRATEARRDFWAMKREQAEAGRRRELRREADRREADNARIAHWMDRFDAARFAHHPLSAGWGDVL